MHELSGHAEDLIRDPPVGDDGADRDVARAKPLRTDDKIGDHPPVVERKIGSGAAKSGHDLIGDEEDLMAIADLADDGKVFGGRDNGGIGRPR